MMFRIRVEQFGNGTVFEHGADGTCQQRRDRQNSQTVPTLFFRNRHGIGEHDLACAAVLQSVHGRAGQHAMRGDYGHRLGSRVLQHVACARDGTGGVDQVIDKHAVLAGNVADHTVGDRLVRAGDVARLVHESERTAAETLRPLLGLRE